MTTLIAVYNSEGCVGRCDARCYNAVLAPCTCICGGANHGAGRARAQCNTAALAEDWMARWAAAHPDTDHFEVPGAQLALLAG
jgi:hypothetical protein